MGELTWFLVSVFTIFCFCCLMAYGDIKKMTICHDAGGTYINSHCLKVETIEIMG